MFKASTEHFGKVLWLTFYNLHFQTDRDIQNDIIKTKFLKSQQKELCQILSVKLLFFSTFSVMLLCLLWGKYAWFNSVQRRDTWDQPEELSSVCRHTLFISMLNLHPFRQHIFMLALWMKIITRKSWVYGNYSLELSTSWSMGILLL